MKDFIKDTWEKQAATYKDSHWVSWGDIFAITLEIDNIAKWIKDGDKVLDIGCANGYSAFEQLKKHDIEICGVDYAENMIESALQIKEKSFSDKKISFKTGDIRKIEYPAETFDVVYTTRVLINLPNWEEQITGINE